MISKIDLQIALKSLKNSFTYFIEDKDAFICKVRALDELLDSTPTDAEVDETLIPKFSQSEVLNLHREGGFTVGEYINLLDILCNER